MSIYSYKIENGVVVDATLSDGTCAAEWLIENFGGFWIDSETRAWVGGTWDPENGFQPPIVPE